MSDYRPLAISDAINGWIEYFKSNSNVLSDHGLSFINTLLGSLNLQYANDADKKYKTNNYFSSDTNDNSVTFVSPFSYYDNLLSISDSEYNKHLRSKDSLQHFKNHFDNVVNLESSIRQISPFFLYSLLWILILITTIRYYITMLFPLMKRRMKLSTK